MKRNHSLLKQKDCALSIRKIFLITSISQGAESQSKQCQPQSQLTLPVILHTLQKVRPNQTHRLTKPQLQTVAEAEAVAEHTQAIVHGQVVQAAHLAKAMVHRAHQLRRPLLQVPGHVTTVPVKKVNRVAAARRPRQPRARLLTILTAGTPTHQCLDCISVQATLASITCWKPLSHLHT